MSSQTFMLPDLGEGLTEAVIVQWLVAEGDEVTIDQTIAEVETAKSIVELPTPFAGTVLRLHAAEGDTVDVGAPVIEVGDKAGSGGGAAAPEQPAATQAQDRTEAEAYRTEERAGSGNVLIGYGTDSVAAKGRRRRKSQVSTPAPAASPAAPAPAASPNAATSATATSTVAVRSPIVRRLARDLGVDVRACEATGRDGAVTRADVLRAAETGAGVAAAGVAGSSSNTLGTPGAATAPATAGTPVDGMHGLAAISTEKLSPLRKAVSAKMSRSRAEIPEATVWVDVDFTELWNLRPSMAAAGEKAPSITALVARFALMALQNYPLLASRLSDDGSEITQFDGVNLGVAVNGDRGLSVPVLPHAERLTVAELDTALREVSAEARTGRLAPAQLSGSTFTLNNYGGFGVDGSAAIINHPEVAILGMGRVIERPWVVDGEIVVRRIAQLSFVFDHRVCDGGYASGFLGELIGMIEHPARAFTRL